jgi:hypothetical protein
MVSRDPPPLFLEATQGHSEKGDAGQHDSFPEMVPFHGLGVVSLGLFKLPERTWVPRSTSISNWRDQLAMSSTLVAFEE